MDQNLANYIQKAREYGQPDEEIKKNLLNTGWDAAAVESAFGAGAPGNAAAQNKPLGSAPQKPDLLPTNLPIASVAPASPAAAGTVPMPGQDALQKSGMRTWAKWAIIAAAIAIIGAGGYLAYAYVYNNPTKIWNKFIGSQADKTYQTKLTFSYTDKNTLDQDKQGLLGSFQLSDLKLAFDGSSYVDQGDMNNPKASADIQYTFGSGNTSFSTGLQYRLLGNVLYLNVGDNPLLGSIMSNISSANGGQSVHWIKLDLNEAQQLSNDDAQVYKELTDPSLRDDLAKIWTDANFIKVDHYMGREKINGKTVLHYANTIDKSVLKDALNKYISRLQQAAAGGTSAEGFDTAQKTVGAILDRMEVKNFETWIGATDFKLYRVKLVTNAPSLISLINNADGIESLSSGGSVADSKRLADVRQMASALELYYNDRGGYPAANQGKPLGLVPNYIGTLPVAPAATGQCADFYNTYWYTPRGQQRMVNGTAVYDSYDMTFCLGSDTGGYKAGVGKLIPGGREANIPCPAEADKCVNASGGPQTEEDKINQALDKISFNAEFQIDASYSDYGKTQDVQAPDDSFDILKELAAAQSKNRDAKRISDTRQLTIALELYYNDFNAYPADLQTLSPTYIGIVPKAPEPPDGSCTADNNQYHYIPQGSSAYQIIFCIGNDTGGYKAGPNILDQTGFWPQNNSPYYQ